MADAIRPVGWMFATDDEAETDVKSCPMAAMLLRIATWTIFAVKQDAFYIQELALITNVMICGLCLACLFLLLSRFSMDGGVSFEHAGNDTYDLKPHERPIFLPFGLRTSPVASRGRIIVGFILINGFIGFLAIFFGFYGFSLLEEASRERAAMIASLAKSSVSTASPIVESAFLS